MLQALLRALLVFVIATSVFADNWPTAVVDWPANPTSPADVSFLLDAPAGKNGFVSVKDGHLVAGNGKRLRIWGLNATMQGALPDKTSAPIIAANLARMGINCIRFHFLDRPAPTGLIDPKSDDTQHFDAAQLDRMDFFIAELKARGIYSDINLHVGRQYKPADGVRDAALLGLTKAVTYYNPRIIELQKDYATALLTHVNPYNKTRYADEPAVALIEFVNENSLVEAWTQGRLEGKQTTAPTDTWHDIPASYADELAGLYNQWLSKNIDAATLAAWRKALNLPENAAIPRLSPKEFAAAPADRFRAEARFLMETEDAFFQSMARHIRQTIGAKAPLIGNSDHGHGNSCYPLSASLSKLDVVDGHVYWQHPKYLTSAAGRRAGFEIPNTPMVDDPLHSAPVQLSRSAVAGKPYTISEVNHPFPAEHACEGIPILAACAAFQDWDGIFWYTLAHKDIATMDSRVAGHFDLGRDPVRMTQLSAGALMFLRGDAAPAKQTVGRTYSAEQTLDSLRLRNAWPYFTPNFPLALPLTHGVRINSFVGPATAPFDPIAPGDIRSDTNQITWLGGKGSGRVVIDTPRSQSLIGRLAGESTANLSASLKPEFCAITLSSLDNAPIAESKKLLLSIATRTANTDIRWNEKRTSLEDWGHPPTTVEPISGKITLHHLAAAGPISAQPLDPTGRPAGAPVKLPEANASATLEIQNSPVLWYVLSR